MMLYIENTPKYMRIYIIYNNGIMFLPIQNSDFFAIDEEMGYTSDLKMLQNQRFTVDTILTQVAE